MNAGRFTISGALLAKLMHLPEGAKILRLREHPDMAWGRADLEVMVTHDGLPEVKDGDVVPVVYPRFTSIDGKVSLSSWNA